MGWYELTSLISDSRIRFLLGFIVVAIVFAITLVVVERRVRKKKEVVEKKAEDESYVVKARRIVRSDKPLKQKLEEFDEVVKRYFRDHFGTNLNTSYSDLIEEFEKTGRADFLEYCNMAFKTIYSSGRLSQDKIEVLAKEFIGAVRRKEHEDELEKGKSFIEKIRDRLMYPFNLVHNLAESFRRFIRKNRREVNKKKAEAKKEEKLKQIEEENNFLKKQYERRKKLRETLREKKELEEQEAIQRKFTSEKVRFFKRSSDLKEESLSGKVPFNFPKSLKKESKKLESVGEVKTSDEKKEPAIIKDSFKGNFEMFPPVNQKTREDIIGNVKKVN